MTDPIQTPVADPTGDQNGASSSQMNPPISGTPVSPAQVQQQQTPPQSGQSTTHNNNVDVSAMIAQYEARIRNLMSEKDKAINERNQAINAQAQMQQQLTEYQQQSSTTIASTTDAAQRAIDENKQLRASVQSLQAELQRAQVVLSKPELAPYIQFIPAESDAEKLKAAVEQLEQIRMNDLQRAGVRLLPGQQQPISPLPPFTSQGTGTPQQQQQALPGQDQQNLYALYGQRPNMAPVAQVGSTPATMSPTGAGDALQSIDQMLKAAIESGDRQKFEDAVKQSALLATQDINRQIGRA